MIYDFLYTLFGERGQKAIPLSHNSKHILKSVEYMQKNYQKSITLASLSKLVFMSKDHFLRVFKKQMGQTPIDYLIHLRVEKAKHLLASSQSSVEQIARAMSYDDPAYFSRLFRKHVGVSPVQYRQQGSL